MISDTFYKDQSDIVDSIIEIDKQIKEESAKEKSDGDKITKLRFEQMLRGLYLDGTIYGQRFN